LLPRWECSRSRGRLWPRPSRSTLRSGRRSPSRRGAISFADAVVEYVPGTGGVTAPYQGSGNTLGQPDYTGANDCADQASCTFLSLGNGGSITLRFTDNLLTGSSTNGQAD